MMYNDAYMPILGDKHPAALGQPPRAVWWDIWELDRPDARQRHRHRQCDLVR